MATSRSTWRNVGLNVIDTNTDDFRRFWGFTRRMTRSNLRPETTRRQLECRLPDGEFQTLIVRAAEFQAFAP
jgi:hypothetical protein